MIGDGWTNLESVLDSDNADSGDEDKYWTPTSATSCTSRSSSKQPLAMDDSLLKDLGKISEAHKSSVSNSEWLLTMLENKNKKSTSQETWLMRLQKKQSEG
jgi:hypothetical protein